MQAHTDNLLNVVYQINDWNKEGRKMPGYTPGYGVKYLLHLLNYPIHTSHLILKEKHTDLLRNLNGPNGWTFLQILIAKKYGNKGSV